MVSQTVSAILQKNMPEKQKDSGMFSLPCVIGIKKIERAMLDLGASINVMPYSVFQDLKLNDLHETGVVMSHPLPNYLLNLKGDVKTINITPLVTHIVPSYITSCAHISYINIHRTQPYYT